eukprot:TRINITY_DN4878_c0_g1_i3.p1 TRINITY_DN4878_c0_g1~~TRINITY_DN4878_c0_g1_i3.p1  ORF type:complete len:406 (-),score=81.28 TRINITY_DN4878_c0_g1_i3:1008-2225(-)
MVLFHEEAVAEILSKDIKSASLLKDTRFLQKITSILNDDEIRTALDVIYGSKPALGKQRILTPNFAFESKAVTLMRNKDWSTTSLGHPDTWSNDLKMLVWTTLASHFPEHILLGSDYKFIYNDAYMPILGDRVDTSFAAPLSQVWGEIFEEIKAILDPVYFNGEKKFIDNGQFILTRNGYKEETYFTFSETPCYGSDGSIIGVRAILMETTGAVLHTRRMQSLRNLDLASISATTMADACTASLKSLETNNIDIPFGMLYLQDKGHHLVCRSTCGIEIGHDAVPDMIELPVPHPPSRSPRIMSTSSSTNNIPPFNLGSTPNSSRSSSPSPYPGVYEWPILAALSSGESMVVNQIDEKFSGLPGGSWNEAPSTAVVIPISLTESIQVVLILGVNKRRIYDHDFQQS